MMREEPRQRVCGTGCVLKHVWEVFSDSVKLTRAEEDQYGEALPPPPHRPAAPALARIY